MWDNPLFYTRIKISASPTGRLTVNAIIHKHSNQLVLKLQSTLVYPRRKKKKTCIKLLSNGEFSTFLFIDTVGPQRLQ